MTSLGFISTRRERGNRELWREFCLFAAMVPDLELVQRDEDGDILVRREMGDSDLFEEDKENMCVVLEDLLGPLLSLQRSPLPLGYLRLPLQDITGVLSSMNVWFFWLSLAHFVSGCKFYICEFDEAIALNRVVFYSYMSILL